MPKIISKRYELMKLCDINCSGPVFLRHTVVVTFINASLVNNAVLQEWSSTWATESGTVVSVVQRTHR